MLTAEVRINGRLVGLCEIRNDATGDDRVASYDVRTLDLANETERRGRVERFDRDDGPLALVQRALAETCS